MNKDRLTGPKIPNVPDGKSGVILFDDNGEPKGVVIPDGSLDYTSPNEEVTIVIKSSGQSQNNQQ